MKGLNAVAAALLVVGGLNWGLVALAEFDLVAWIFGEEFGTTNAASRIVYGLVGLAAIYAIGALLAQRRTVDARGRPPLAADQHRAELEHEKDPQHPTLTAVAAASAVAVAGPASAGRRGAPFGRRQEGHRRDRGRGRAVHTRLAAEEGRPGQDPEGQGPYTVFADRRGEGPAGDPRAPARTRRSFARSCSTTSPDAS